MTFLRNMVDGIKYNIDYSLYLITDRNLLGNRNIENIVEEAIQGGVTVVQLREKDGDSVFLYEQALLIKTITDKYNIPLIINDRVDIMLAADAAGVHVGQTDLPVAVVRKIIGKNKVLGVSASSLEEALQAEFEGADYLGVGSIFLTKTKLDTKKTSLQTLQQITQSVHIPTLAIGGIHLDNIDNFKNVNIEGICVVSEIMGAKDPYSRALQLRSRLRETGIKKRKVR